MKLEAVEESNCMQLSSSILDQLKKNDVLVCHKKVEKKKLKSPFMINAKSNFTGRPECVRIFHVGDSLHFFRL